MHANVALHLGFLLPNVVHFIRPLSISSHCPSELLKCRTTSVWLGPKPRLSISCAKSKYDWLHVRRVCSALSMAKRGQLKGKNQPVPWRIERSLHRVRDWIALLPVSVGPERCERASMYSRAKHESTKWYYHEVTRSRGSMEKDEAVSIAHR